MTLVKKKKKKTEKEHVGELISEDQITPGLPGPLSRREDKRAY